MALPADVGLFANNFVDGDEVFVWVFKHGNREEKEEGESGGEGEGVSGGGGEWGRGRGGDWERG